MLQNKKKTKKPKSKKIIVNVNFLLGHSVNSNIN